VSSRAYRVAPRRRTAGRPASRVNWDRVGRVSLVLILFVILVLYINPVVNFVDAWRDSRAESAQLAELKTENRELRERAATLEDPDAPEQGARMQGLVQPDERSVVICPREGCEPGK
jgi:cell division protein FtsB